MGVLRSLGLSEELPALAMIRARTGQLQDAAMAERIARLTQDNPVASKVAMIQDAINHIHTNAVTPEMIAELSAELGQMPAVQAMAVAKEVGLMSAVNRKQAAERLQRKLSDLYYTHRKSRMYGGGEEEIVFPTEP